MVKILVTPLNSWDASHSLKEGNKKKFSGNYARKIFGQLANLTIQSFF